MGAKILTRRELLAPRVARGLLSGPLLDYSTEQAEAFAVVTSIPFLKRLFRFLICTFAATVFAGCTSAQMPRNVYEGARVYQESLKTTPLENPKGALPGYDQYEKERQGIMLPPTSTGSTP